MTKISTPPKSLSTIVLVTASPARRVLFEQLGYPHVRYAIADIDETIISGETPHQCVLRLAEQKAKAVVPEENDAVMIGCDTMIVCGDAILGKPKDQHDAHQMLTLLNARTHEVCTGLAVLEVASGNIMQQVVTSRVVFKDNADEVIAAYVATGEPMGKAGGYALQGLGRTLIDHVEGDETNVIGLPLPPLQQLLKRVTK